MSNPAWCYKNRRILCFCFLIKYQTLWLFNFSVVEKDDSAMAFKMYLSTFLELDSFEGFRSQLLLNFKSEKLCCNTKESFCSVVFSRMEFWHKDSSMLYALSLKVRTLQPLLLKRYFSVKSPTCCEHSLSSKSLTKENLIIVTVF